MNTECDCGFCRKCHRAMGLAPAVPEKKVQLSASTLEILANLDRPKQVKPKAQKVIKPKEYKPRPKLDWCKAGLHKMEGDNLYLYGDRNGRQRRECRACRNGHSAEWRSRNREAKPAVEPAPCIECGFMIALRDDLFQGKVLSGAEGKCEVCYDREVISAKLAEAETWSPELQNKKRSTVYRWRHMLQRVLKDGRAYSPIVKEHGCNNSYMKHGCRCEPCREWKKDDNQRRRNAA